MMNNINIERISSGPKHHLFGFHDLIISNKDDTKYLCIEANYINRPPLPNESFGVGYIENQNFIKLGDTTAFNYPQGSRQQWVADTNCFTVNNRVGQNWGTDLYDANCNKLLDRYQATTHVLTKDGRYSFGLDYARLQRLGGYGYTGLVDANRDDQAPMDSGISIMDMQSKEIKLLVSVKQVAEFKIKNTLPTAHHYLTHLTINPASNRLAFLHRYFLPDGGQITRLMTVGIDGTGLRTLGQGFLSHYDWKDDMTIYIYGRCGSHIDMMRGNPIFANPIIRSSVRFAKKTIKNIIGKDKSIVNGSNFLMITDEDSPKITPFAINTIFDDGHPMTNPYDNDWCICDTYPNPDGDRCLFLYNFSSDKRFDLGLFRRLFDDPDTTEKDQFLFGIDSEVIKNISETQLAFTRSGLHCDLHPRWSSSGKYAVFDSIHEGSRQIYRVDTSSLINLKY